MRSNGLGVLLAGCTASGDGRPDHLHGLRRDRLLRRGAEEPFLRNAQTGLFRYALWGPR